MSDGARQTAHAPPAGRGVLRGFDYSPRKVVSSFAVVLLLSGALIFFFGVLPLSAPETRFAIPGLVLAIGVYVTETRVIQFRFRRESQAFSFNEIPIILGLLFSTPATVVASCLAGYLTALVLTRRQRGAKLGVNVGHNLLGLTVAVTVFHAVARGATSPGPQLWIAAATAVVSASLISIVAIFLAISISERAVDLTKLGQAMLTGIAATVTAASLVLIGVTLTWERPVAAVLLVVPSVSLYLAFKAYSSEKEKHESLEFLYVSSRILQDMPEVSDAILALLEEATRTFRTRTAEVFLLPGDDDGPTLRARVDDRGNERLGQITLSPGEQCLVEVIDRRRAPVVVDRDDDPALHEFLSERGFNDVMAVPLQGETRMIGVLLVAERLNRVSTYRDDELRLIETLAANASVTFENTRLERTLLELHELKDELRHQAEHDALTGLANRALFTSRLAQALAEQGSVGMLFLDLDDFKGVNDTLGHEAGDELLVHISRRIRNCLRPDDLAARLGGDEFAVLLPGPTTPRTAELVAQRILSALDLPISVAGHELFIGASIGIALSREGQSPGHLIRNADVAMYHAKHDRKGRFALFEAEMHTAHAQRLTLRSELMRGLDEDQFKVAYQPLYDLRSSTVVGAEALLRWDHPTFGVVGPDHFIELAEETGLVLELGKLVLDRAVSQLAAWQRQFSPGFVVSVNLSAFEFRHERIVELVGDAISAAGIRPETLVLELTERDVMDDTEASLDRLLALRRLGVQLALDDFGTGYSSLAYLRRFPFDIIKIAKEFIDGVTQFGDDGALVRAVIELTHALDMRPIAEGIETAQQRDKLLAWGCEVGQGWLWSRAVHPDDFDDILADAGVTRLFAADARTPGPAGRQGQPQAATAHRG